MRGLLGAIGSPFQLRFQDSPYVHIDESHCGLVFSDCLSVLYWKMFSDCLSVLYWIEPSSIGWAMGNLQSGKRPKRESQYCFQASRVTNGVQSYWARREYRQRVLSVENVDQEKSKKECAQQQWQQRRIEALIQSVIFSTMKRLVLHPRSAATIRRVRQILRPFRLTRLASYLWLQVLPVCLRIRLPPRRQCN